MHLNLLIVLPLASSKIRTLWYHSHRGNGKSISAAACFMLYLKGTRNVVQPSTPIVELFSKPDCHLCEEVKALLRELQLEHSFILREINIATHETLLAQYGEEIPVVFINGRKAFKYRVDPQQFVRRLQRARDCDDRRRWRRIWRR
jgi:glutaredoxin